LTDALWHQWREGISARVGAAFKQAGAALDAHLPGMAQ